jgi:cytochrome bd-type quinol oxidase subunit 1
VSTDPLWPSKPSLEHYMTRSPMKSLIVFISLITAIAFLGLSIISTWQIFTSLIGGADSLRGELWALLIMTFTAGVIMILLAWGITEVGSRPPAARSTTPETTEEE